METPDELETADLVTALKAAAEPTRLRIVDEIPRNAMMKPRRGHVRDLLAGPDAGPDAGDAG